jgi:hypothetical protein
MSQNAIWGGCWVWVIVLAVVSMTLTGNCRNCRLYPGCEPPPAIKQQQESEPWWQIFGPYDW